MESRVKKSDLEQRLIKLNKENLLQGLDSEGREMPHYANTEYGAQKYARNPRNQGRWDLYNTGQFYRGISTKIMANRIKFSQKFRNKKTEWLAKRLENVTGENRALGVPKDQYQKEFEKLIPDIRDDIFKFIKRV